MSTLEKLCPTKLFPLVSAELAQRMARDEGKTACICAHCGKYHLAEFSGDARG